MAQLDLQPVLDLQPEETKLDLQPVPTGDYESLPAAFKDIVQNAGSRLAKLGEQVKQEFTSGEAVKPIGGGLPILPHPADESALGGYARGAYNVPAGFINAAITPAGLATVGSFALGQPEIGAALIAAQLTPGAIPLAKRNVQAATGQLSPGESLETALTDVGLAAPLVHEAIPVDTTKIKPIDTSASKSEFPVDKTGVTEPPPVPKEFLPETSTITGDLTRKLIDARKGLLEESRQLQVQADISKQATGTVHPAVQERIDAINEELNHPTVGVPVTPDTPIETVLKATGKSLTVEPDEAGRTVATSPASTAPGEIPAGQQQVSPEESLSVGTGLEGATAGQGRGVSVTAGMSRATVEADIQRGILPEDALVTGEGWNADEAGARGQYLINQGVHPDTVLDALAGRRKFPGEVKDAGDAVAVIQAEKNRFGAERAAAIDQYGIGSPQAKLATAAEADWVRRSRPQAGGLAQRIMTAFMDADPVDLGSFDGLYKKALDLVDGKDIPEGQQIEMARKAKKVQVARAGEADAVAKRDQVIERTLPRIRVKSEADMKSMVDDMVKRMTPCK